MTDPAQDKLADAARQAADRDRLARDNPEPSLGARFGQIGILGWMISAPMLLGLLLGRWLDAQLASGILLSAAFLMLGAGLGFWSAWNWMHRGL